MRGAQASAAGFAVRLAARLLFLLIVARLFGAAAFGAYAIAVATVELIVAAGSLGTKKSIFQLLNDCEADEARPAAHRVVDLALLVTAASLVPAALAIVVSLSLPPNLLSPATSSALVFLAPAAAAQALLDLFLAATRWKHAIRYEVVARSIIEPWGLVGGAVLAWLLDWKAEGLVIGYWCGTLAALAYALLGAGRSFGGFRLAAYRAGDAGFVKTLRGLLSNTSTDVMNTLYIRADLLLVGILLGESSAGLYGMARQLTAPLRQVRQSFDGLLIPLVAKSLAMRGAAASSEAVTSSTRLILVLQLPYLLALVVAGEPFLAWLRPEFAAAYAAMVVLAVAETMQSAFSIGDLVFVYLRPRIGLSLTMVSIGIGVIGALLLIPPLGILGAALSVLAAHGVRTAWRSSLLRSRFDFATDLSHHMAPIAAMAAATAVGLAVGFAPPLALAASLAVYAGALLLWARIGGHSLGLTGFHGS